jgi:hypothetical protein
MTTSDCARQQRCISGGAESSKAADDHWHFFGTLEDCSSSSYQGRFRCRTTGRNWKTLKSEVSLQPLDFRPFLGRRCARWCLSPDDQAVCLDFAMDFTALGFAGRQQKSVISPFDYKAQDACCDKLTLATKAEGTGVEPATVASD